MTDHRKFFSRQIHAVEIVAKRIAASARVGTRAQCSTLDRTWQQGQEALDAAGVAAYGSGRRYLSPRHEARLELAQCQLRYATKAAELRCKGRTYRDDEKLEAALVRYDACAARAKRRRG